MLGHSWLLCKINGCQGDFISFYLFVKCTFVWQGCAVLILSNRRQNEKSNPRKVIIVGVFFIYIIGSEIPWFWLAATNKYMHTSTQFHFFFELYDIHLSV